MNKTKVKVFTSDALLTLLSLLGCCAAGKSFQLMKDLIKEFLQNHSTKYKPLAGSANEKAALHKVYINLMRNNEVSCPPQIVCCR